MSISEDMMDGLICDICGCFYFENNKLYSHGHPATCKDCWEYLTPKEREFHSLATATTDYEGDDDGD